MNHLKSFENFGVNEENILRKWTTGHETKGDESKAEQIILDKLAEVEKDIKSNPDRYAQSKGWDNTKKRILEKAKENRFRGSIRVQKGGTTNKLFVIYDDKSSDLQKIGSAAASRTSSPLGGKN